MQCEAISLQAEFMDCSGDEATGPAPHASEQEPGRRAPTLHDPIIAEFAIAEFALIDTNAET